MLDLSSNTFRDLVLLSLIGLLAYLPGLSSLPPIDRDEARYTQATVQMIETGDFIDIRFQDDARHKKPAGAYWAQVASLTATGQIDDVKRGERAIWAHRLPSVLGALIAVWATYLAGLSLFGRREALVGAGLLAVSVSLVFEAHIAKTDALLAGACAVVLYGLVARKPWPVWLGMAAGMLIKGPVILSIAALALIVSAISDRSTERVRAVMRPLPILTTLVLTLPWFIAIGIQTDGAFFAEALGRDFGGKLAGAQETHGGAPGYYILTTLVMFWPGILAVPIAGIFAWRNRHKSEVRLLLAWIVPMWLILELVPTKLPHYTLPLYPALALLAGAAWVQLADAKKTRRVGLVLALIIGGLLALVVSATLWGFIDMIWVALIAAGLIVLSTTVCLLLWRGNAMPGFAVAALFLAVGFGGILSNSPLLDLSPRIAAVLPTDARLISPDYREPSLVFLAGTKTQLSRQGAVPGGLLLLNAETKPPTCADAGATVDGTNYAKGQEVSLTLYRTDDCSAVALSDWAQTTP